VLALSIQLSDPRPLPVGLFCCCAADDDAANQLLFDAEMPVDEAPIAFATVPMPSFSPVLSSRTSAVDSVSLAFRDEKHSAVVAGVPPLSMGGDSECPDGPCPIQPNRCLPVSSTWC
jgi:hypothetical protein